MYRWILRPLLFTLPPGLAHALGNAALAPLEFIAPLRAVVKALGAAPDPRLATEVLGLKFASPIGLAGGFDKNATRARALSSLGFGFLELGTVTARPQEANPAPNMFRLPADRALVNRLGFPNEGASAVVARIASRIIRTGLGVPVGVSIGKSRAVDVDPIEPAIADYLASFKEAREVADFVVVNVSSPNTKNLRAMQGPEIARALLSALVMENASSAKRVPLLVKIAPDLDDADLEKLLAVIEEVNLDGVIATNTTIKRESLATSPERVASIGAGGLSGPPLRARALDVVRRTRARLGPSIAIIGVGGVETGADARNLIAAGANLVQLYTGFIYGGPGAPRAIAKELAAIVAHEGASTLGELVGVDALGGKPRRKLLSRSGQ